MLHVREQVNQRLADTLIATLHNSAVLLVLDNCEHVIVDCAQLVHELLSRCPRVQFLATSREALAVPGEVAWQLPGLGLSASTRRDRTSL